MMRRSLQRFLDAQAHSYALALEELCRGRKTGHWMWYVFPQLQGLGMSPTSQLYAIHDLDEAREYLRHPTLGTRLRACVDILLALPNPDAEAIFGFPDALKLRSCLTLFEQAAGESASFGLALDVLYGGQRDQRTLTLLTR